MKRVDKVQLKIMEALKDSHVSRIGAMNALQYYVIHSEGRS